MIQKMVFMLSMVLVQSVMAQTIMSNNGDLYMGEELYNEHPTGRECYIYVDLIEANPRGLHCYDLTSRAVFFTDRDKQPKDEIKLIGHITNSHRPEYPAMKTCAMGVDGKTSGMNIYEKDTASIFNQMFSWAGKYNGAQFDYFILMSPVTKQPTEARLHKMTWSSEVNYDCVKLHKM